MVNGYSIDSWISMSVFSRHGYNGYHGHFNPEKTLFFLYHMVKKRREKKKV